MNFWPAKLLIFKWLGTFFMMVRHWIFWSYAGRTFCQPSLKSYSQAESMPLLLQKVLCFFFLKFNSIYMSWSFIWSLSSFCSCNLQPYYRYSDSLTPDVWFEPTEVPALIFTTFFSFPAFSLIFFCCFFFSWLFLYS